MKLEDVWKARARAAQILAKTGISVTPREKETLEIADFGLNDLGHYGIEVLVYESNDRYCAKELVLFPRQICPEHHHPPIDEHNIGKQETFRCRWGIVYLYVEGKPTRHPQARVPAGDEALFSVWHEIVLRPGDQYTLPPGRLHWFQAGREGAVLSEFSSKNLDETDVWRNPRIKRIPTIE
jgi:D-lyxose ketol-isomerase